MNGTFVKMMLVCFSIATSWIFITSDALSQDEQAPNLDSLKQGVLRQSGDDVSNAQGKVIPPRASGGEATSDSMSVPSNGVDVFELPEQPNGDPGISTESHTGCTRWWIHGYDSYSWKHYGLFISAKFYSSSRTTYGTSSGSCGEPLYVDRLYLHAYPKPDNPYINFSFEKTGYNTDFIEASNSVIVTGNTPTPCGIKGYHEAYHHGVTWSTTVKVGCQ